MEFISGSSNFNLARKIAKNLNKKLLPVQIEVFPNGEKKILVSRLVKGEHTVIIQSFSKPVDEHIIETLLIIDAVKRAGAKSINLIIPWLGYSLQDKIFRAGEPFSAHVITDIISNSGANSVFVLDIHNKNVLPFFSIPVYHVTTTRLFADYIKKNFNLTKCVIVSPDQGSIGRAEQLANMLSLPIASLRKERNLITGKTKTVGLRGKVINKTVILYDDGIITGQTLNNSVNLLNQKGAREIHFIATNGLFTQNALSIIEKINIKSILITNSVNIAKLPKIIKKIDISSLFIKGLTNLGYF